MGMVAFTKVVVDFDGIAGFIALGALLHESLTDSNANRHHFTELASITDLYNKGR